MQSQKKDQYFNDGQSWMHDINSSNKNIIDNKQSPFISVSNELRALSSHQFDHNPFAQFFTSQHEIQHSSQQLMKRQRSDDLTEDKNLSSNLSSNQFDIFDQFNLELQGNASKQPHKQRKNRKQEKNEKEIKQIKQSLYSKTYRQRKKQRLKVLEQENQYLKKKIQELHFRLRQKQMELNRLKYGPQQKELSIEQLNTEFLKKVTIQVKDIHKVYPQYSNQDLAKSIISQKQKEVQNYMKTFESSFIQIFDKHGFGGTKKKQCLNYYLSQILEGALKDSERYLFLIYSIKSSKQKDLFLLNGHQAINQYLFEIGQQIGQSRKNDMIKFILSLSPIFTQYNNICSKLWQNFEKLTNCADQIHTALKTKYLEGHLDWIQFRVKLQNWFQFHKYDKFMRRMKEQWLQFIKQGQNKEICVENINKNSKKKLK